MENEEYDRLAVRWWRLMGVIADHQLHKVPTPRLKRLRAAEKVLWAKMVELSPELGEIAESYGRKHLILPAIKKVA